MKIVNSEMPPVTTTAVAVSQPVPPAYTLAVYSKIGEPYGYCMLTAKPAGSGKVIKIKYAQLVTKYVQSGCLLFTDGTSLFAYCA